MLFFKSWEQDLSMQELTIQMNFLFRLVYAPLFCKKKTYFKVDYISNMAYNKISLFFYHINIFCSFKLYHSKRFWKRWRLIRKKDYQLSFSQIKMWVTFVFFVYLKLLLIFWILLIFFFFFFFHYWLFHGNFMNHMFVNIIY